MRDCLIFFIFHFLILEMFCLKLRPLLVDDVLRVYLVIVEGFLGVHLPEELFQFVI